MGTTEPNRQLGDSLSQQERLAREYLAQGRFRKARDEFKVLCKADRPRFLPLLVEANIQLGLEMFRKGMVGEARQLVEYLKTIATPEQVLSLELELGLQPSVSAPGGILGVIFDKIATSSITTTERERLADRAVLVFESLPNPRAEFAALAGELDAVLAGLEAVSKADYSRALDLVRPLGQSSAFAHWKIFIRGLCAFYRGEREKARRTFEGVPVGTAPGKASQAFLLLLGTLPLNPSADLPPEPVVEAACQLTGNSGLGGVILRAEKDWRAGKGVSMYQSLSKGIADFPAEGIGLTGLLTEFAFNCFFALPEQSRFDYGRMVDDILRGREGRHDVEKKMHLRIIMVAGADILAGPVAFDFLQEFIRLRQKLHGPNDVLDSMAYGFLGQALLKPRAQDEDFDFPPSLRQRTRSSETALQLLENAVRLDPSNLSASLCLCNLYEKLRQRSERNRLLDQMTERFPEDKSVLMLAAQGCLDRKAFKKGLDYLTQARMSDGLDPAIPDRLAEANLSHAADLFQKGRGPQAREALRAAQSFEVETPDNLARGRWCLRIHQGLMESCWGDEEKARALLDEARQASPSMAAFLFYAGSKNPGVGRRSGDNREYLLRFSELARKSANGADAVILARIWQHRARTVSKRMADEMRRLLGLYLLEASKRRCSPEAACKLVEFSLAENWFFDAASGLVNARLALDPKDPQFRLLRLRLRSWGAEEAWTEDQSELEEILAEAARRKDDHTVQQARKRLDALKHAPPPPPFFDPFGSDPDFDDPSDDSRMDEDFEESDGKPLTWESVLDDLPPRDYKLMKGVLDMLANASSQELKALKETMPQDLMGLNFDDLLAVARGKRQSSPPPPPPAPIRPGKPEPRKIWHPDPNQPDLF